MFSVGQKVWLRQGGRSGTVLECYGDQVCIRQDNGAELDVPASGITADPPAGAATQPRAPGSRQPRDAAPDAPRVAAVRTLSPRDITPMHERVLSAVPVRTLQAVAALYERRPNAGRFSALDTAGKLNVIAEITNVPYRVMQRYSDSSGELGLVMGKGLADSTRAR